MMPGMIMLWAGAVVDIPSGWHECNGDMGTPDLRNKFIPAAGIFLPQGSTGGSFSHDHDFTGDGHLHSLPEGDNVINSSPAGDFAANTDAQPAVGTTDVGNSVPPYHALVYIMKL